MTRLRIGSLLLVVGSLLFLGVSGASAAPVNSHSRNLTTLTVSCDNGMIFNVVVPGSSGHNSKNVDAAHIVDSTSIFATKSLSLTITEGSQTVLSRTINHAVNGSFHGSLVTCQGSNTFIDPFTGLLATLSVVAQGFITP